MGDSLRPRVRRAAPDWVGALGYASCAALGWICLNVARVAGRVPSFEASIATVITALFVPLAIAAIWTSLVRSLRGRD